MRVLGEWEQTPTKITSLHNTYLPHRKDRRIDRCQDSQTETYLTLECQRDWTARRNGQLGVRKWYSKREPNNLDLRTNLPTGRETESARKVSQLRLSLKAGAIKHSLRDLWLDHKRKWKAYLTLDGETDKEKKKKNFPSSSHPRRGAVNQGEVRSERNSFRRKRRQPPIRGYLRDSQRIDSPRANQLHQ